MAISYIDNQENFTNEPDTSYTWLRGPFYTYFEGDSVVALTALRSRLPRQYIDEGGIQQEVTALEEIRVICSKLACQGCPVIGCPNS